MLAALDLIPILLGLCALAAIALVVCIVGAVNEAVQRLRGATTDDEGDAWLRSLAEPDDLADVGAVRSVDLAGASDAVRIVTATAEVEPTGSADAIDDQPAATAEAVVATFAVRAPVASAPPSSPAEPAEPAAPVAEPAETDATAAPAETVAPAAQAAPTAPSRPPTPTAPTLPVPVVRLPRYAELPQVASTSDLGIVLADGEASWWSAPSIDAPTASQLAARVVDLDSERLRRTGELPIVQVDDSVQASATRAPEQAAAPEQPAAASLPSARAATSGDRTQTQQAPGHQDPAATVAALADVEASSTGGRRRRRSRRGADDAPSGRRLPAGAEAALESIVAVRSDPRSPIALRDPTSEIRLTSADRAGARRRAAETSTGDRRSA